MKKLLFGLIIMMLAGYSSQYNSSEQTKPSEEMRFVWDFSQPIKYTYSFSQTEISEIQMDKNGPFNKSKTTGTGILNVRVKENNLANLSLTDLEIAMITFDEYGTVEDTMVNTMPTSVIQDMQPNGTFETDNHNIIFDLIFPLPTKSLKIGEKEKIPLHMPFNANGSSVIIEGYNSLEFEGMEIIDGKECAVLKGEIDIADLEIPEELIGTYDGSLIGNGTYYFNLKDKYLVGADIQMITEILMDSKTEEPDALGLYGDMKSDSELKIWLKKIE